MMAVIQMCKGIIGLETLTGKVRKSAAEWCFILSCLFVVPLLIDLGLAYHYFGVVSKIILQLCWGIVVCRAAFLASETWQKNKK
ncbi:hypothetical protein SJI19_19340 [Acerihabitans sp. TG2]|uniref:hypothetical protein n=1 Tax=Acerihabitans sp. TG2 TaxID=3096008 RepID=UPI002B229A8B|nr:hypothetical protein [Acerihabitans sp. TG2]MEA9392662.1 hypothetical protein [Acerihabitans sp. TG2]